MKNIQDLGKPCFNFTDDVSEFGSESTPMLSLSQISLFSLFLTIVWHIWEELDLEKVRSCTQMVILSFRKSCLLLPSMGQIAYQLLLSTKNTLNGQSKASLRFVTDSDRVNKRYSSSNLKFSSTDHEKINLDTRKLFIPQI